MFIYILKCEDNSLYTGIANDITKRFTEHYKKLAVGAKYTKSHSASKLIALWSCESKSDACRLEYWIKKLTHSQKLLLSENGDFCVFNNEKLSSTTFTKEKQDFIHKINNEVFK